MMFTIEFMRVRDSDNAHAILDRIRGFGSDLEAVKVRARSLFSSLDMPQKPDAMRILDENGRELFFWRPDKG